MKKKNIAIFASGSGTNAENIVRYFSASDIAEVRLIFSNNPDAFVLNRAVQFGIKTFVFNREQFFKTQEVLNILRGHNIEFIVLAGFLWLVPSYLIQAFPKKIVNIHPALLPKYGGKGMYGMHVHKAVISSGDTESGITVHYVNEKYDEGSIIFQARCPLSPGESPETLSEKIHALEYENYPRVIEKLIKEAK